MPHPTLDAMLQVTGPPSTDRRAARSQPVAAPFNSVLGHAISSDGVQPPIELRSSPPRSATSDAKDDRPSRRSETKDEDSRTGAAAESSESLRAEQERSREHRTAAETNGEKSSEPAKPTDEVAKGEQGEQAEPGVDNEQADSAASPTTDPPDAAAQLVDATPGARDSPVPGAADAQATAQATELPQAAEAAADRTDSSGSTAGAGAQLAGDAPSITARPTDAPSAATTQHATDGSAQLGAAAADVAGPNAATSPATATADGATATSDSARRKPTINPAQESALAQSTVSGDDASADEPTPRQIAAHAVDVAATELEGQPGAAELSTADLTTELDDAVGQDNAPARDAPERAASSLERVAAQRSLQPTEPADQQQSLSTVDRVKFVQRVSGALERAHLRDGRVQVRLSPPELGTLKIELAVRQGALTASIEADTAQARNVLLDNLPALRDRLAEQQIRVERFDVDVRRDGQQQQHDSGARPDFANDAPQQEHRRHGSRSAKTEADKIPAAPSAPLPMSDAALDVRV